MIIEIIKNIFSKIFHKKVVIFLIIAAAGTLVCLKLFQLRTDVSISFEFCINFFVLNSKFVSSAVDCKTNMAEDKQQLLTTLSEILNIDEELARYYLEKTRWNTEVN